MKEILIPEDASIIISVDQGDRAWAEDGTTPSQMINGEMISMLGFTFGGRPDWHQVLTVTWEIISAEEFLVRVTGLPGDIALLRSDASRVFHAEIVSG